MYVTSCGDVTSGLPVQGSAHVDDWVASLRSSPSQAKFPVLKHFAYFVIEICVRGCGTVLIFFMFVTVLAGS